MRRLFTKIAYPFLSRFAKYYFTKPRKYRYKKIKAIVLPGVFFPHFTISTKLLLQFLEPRNLEHKSFLELGCGIGIISVLAAKKGAKVLATDINPAAIENTKLNAINSGVNITTIHSDLFEYIPKQEFNFIIINPPYYPKNAQSKAEEAWFCGENFEYFEKLLSSISFYFNQNSEVLMILSEDCELERIKSIADKNRLEISLIFEKRKWGEENYIFQLKCI